jgi:hypothetical protein
MQWDGVGLVTTNLAGVWGISSSRGGVAWKRRRWATGHHPPVRRERYPVADMPGAIAVYLAPDGAHLRLRVDPTQDLIPVRLK